MARILSLLLVVLMVMGLIPTGLVLASQNSVPGDSAYPIKRKMEEIIIALASLHPSTKTFFRVDLASRRFDESAKLVALGKGKLADESLVEFSEQTKATVAEILNTQDLKTRKELAKKMLAQLQTQKARIAEVGSQSNLAQTNQAASQSPTPSPTPVLVQSTITNNFGRVIVIVVTATPTPAPRLLPTATPTPSPVVSTPPPQPAPAPATVIDQGISDLAPIALLEAAARVAPTPTPRPVFEMAGDELPTPTPRPITPTPSPDRPVSNLVGSCSGRASYAEGSIHFNHAFKNNLQATNYTIRINRAPFEIWAPGEGNSGDLVVQTATNENGYIRLSLSYSYGFSVQPGWAHDSSVGESVNGNEFTCPNY